MKMMWKKNIVVFGAVTIALLLVSSATAVPQVHSTPVMKTIKKVEQTKTMIDTSIYDLISQVQNLLKNKKIKAIFSQYQSLLKQKFSKEFIEALREKIKHIFNNEQFNNAILQAHSYLEKKYRKIIDIGSLKEKIKSLLSSDDPEPTFIIGGLIAIYYLIGLIYVFLKIYECPIPIPGKLYVAVLIALLTAWGWPLWIILDPLLLN